MRSSVKCKECAIFTLSDKVVKKAACSNCKIAYDHKRYLKNREVMLARNTAYRRTEKGREVNRRASLKYGQSGRRADLARQYLERLKANPKKYAEHCLRHKVYSMVSYAVKKGELKKGLCENCGSPKVEAHHDDYQQPFEIRWLCKLCHGKTRRLTEV